MSLFEEPTGESLKRAWDAQQRPETHPPEDALLAYTEGRRDPTVEAHVAACKPCLETLLELRRISLVASRPGDTAAASPIWSGKVAASLLAGLALWHAWTGAKSSVPPEPKGRDMAKTVLGCLLTVASVLTLYLRYPAALTLPSVSNNLSGAPMSFHYWVMVQQLQQFMDQLTIVRLNMAAYFTLLRLCLGCVIVGGFLLYTSTSPKLKKAYRFGSTF